MANDAEVRGRLLSVFYDLRHRNSGWVPTSDMNLAGMEAVDSQVIGTVCQHLAESGLIDWKPLRGDEGFVVGMARIRGLGVDVVEGKIKAPIDVALSPQPALIGVSATAHAGTFMPPSFVGVAARGVAGDFVPNTQTEVVSPRASSQRNLGAALNLNGTEVFPSAAKAEVVQSDNARKDAIVIDPTEYPSNTQIGTLVVQNFIPVNLAGEDFQKLSHTMEDLFAELRKSNEIAGEVRDKLVAEMEAGMVILQSPKPDPKLVDLLLKRPLAYVADKAIGTIISTLAATALMALLKIAGLL